MEFGRKTELTWTNAYTALVKSLVQKLNGRVKSLLQVKGQQGLNIEAQRALERVVGEVKLAGQVDMLPAHRRAGGNGVGHRLALSRRGLG
jgi:hypothetical protein